MGAEWIDLAKEGLKYATRPRYAFAIWVTSFLILAVPLPEFLRLDQFRTDHGHWIGIVCLASLVLWIVEGVLFVANSDPVRAYLDHRTKLIQFDSLTWYEAALFIKAVENKCQTLTCGINRDEPYSLIAKGLLERVSEDGKSQPDRFYASLTIPRFVWEHVKKEHVQKALKEIKKID